MYPLREYKPHKPLVRRLFTIIFQESHTTLLHYIKSSKYQSCQNLPRNLYSSSSFHSFMIAIIILLHARQKIDILCNFYYNKHQCYICILQLAFCKNPRQEHIRQQKVSTIEFSDSYSIYFKYLLCHKNGLYYIAQEVLLY